MPKIPQFTEEQIAAAKVYAASTPPADLDPKIEALVNDLIGRVADKWTMLVLEVLAEKGELRFTRLSELVEGISQKMLTQTLRQMELRRSDHEDRASCRAAKGRVQTNASRIEPRGGLLRRMGMGSGKPSTSGAGAPRFRWESQGGLMSGWRVRGHGRHSP